MTRRQALRSVAAAGAGSLLRAPSASGEDAGLQIAGRPVEVSLTAASQWTVRIAIQALAGGQPQPIPSDGALVKEDWGPPAARLRSLPAPRTVKCGGLTVRLAAGATAAQALAIRVEAKGGRVVQDLAVDAQTGALSFQLGLGAGVRAGPGRSAI